MNDDCRSLCLRPESSRWFPLLGMVLAFDIPHSEVIYTTFYLL